MFPLHLAALSGFSDCCRKLLSSGEQPVINVVWLPVIVLTQLVTVQKDTSLVSEWVRYCRLIRFATSNI